MIQHPLSSSPVERTTYAEAPVLRGWWRTGARLVWLVLALLTLGVVVGGIPATAALLGSPCSGDRCAVIGILPAASLELLSSLGIAPHVYAAGYIGFNLTTAIVWWALSGVIMWRRSDDAMAWLVALMLLLQGGTFVTGALDTTNAVARLLDFLSWTMLALVFYLFPSGRFAPSWMRWIALLAIVLNLIYYYAPRYNGSWLGVKPGGAAWFALIVSLMWTQVYRYRHVSNAVQRQQTKWIVFGFSTFYLGALVFALPFPAMVSAGSPDTWVPLLLVVVVPSLRLLIPISIGFAVLYARLWAIDVLINRALVYGTLTALLALIYWGSVVILQQVLAPLLGALNELSVVASTLIIAALFGPLRRRIQATIDRRFYRRKYDAAATLHSFSTRLRNETDLHRLSDDMLAVVQDTLQPAHTSLWLREPEVRS